MKYFIYVILMLIPASYLQANEIAVTMHSLNNDGIDKAIGVIVVKETPQGLRFQPHLQGMAPGKYTFSVNENVGCGSEYSTTGANIHGMAAGKSMKQLPTLKVTEQGKADEGIAVDNLKLQDIRGRTLVISAQRDLATNVALGAEQRVACGSLELYR